MIYEPLAFNYSIEHNRSKLRSCNAFVENFNNMAANVPWFLKKLSKVLCLTQNRSKKKQSKKVILVIDL